MRKICRQTASPPAVVKTNEHSRIQTPDRHPQRVRTGRVPRTVPFKHGLRGILFSWPLYLLPLAAWLLQARYLPLILLLLLPGVYVSGGILRRGVHDDYARLVDGCLLRSGYPGRLLFPGSFGR